MSRPDSFTHEELALAYELRQCGCCWKLIALGLGCDCQSISDAVRYVMRVGL